METIKYTFLILLHNDYVTQKKSFLRCWLSTKSNSIEKGTALLLEPGVEFGAREEEIDAKKHSLGFFLKYLLPFKGQFLQLLVGIVVGSLLQLILPFLTQAMVDVGIGEKNLSLITLILIAQLILFLAQLSVGYLRSWILLHINSRIDISLISDFLIKLMNMPLHFFDTKRTGDIMQRIGDHGRIKKLPDGEFFEYHIFHYQLLLSLEGFLAYYNTRILTIFLIGNTLYVLWISYFYEV